MQPRLLDFRRTPPKPSIFEPYAGCHPKKLGRPYTCTRCLPDLEGNTGRTVSSIVNCCDSTSLFCCFCASFSCKFRAIFASFPSDKCQGILQVIWLLTNRHGVLSMFMPLDIKPHWAALARGKFLS